MRDEYSHWYPITVRWGDMDAFGHVNNATYFTYFESARIHFFDVIELDKHKTKPSQGPALVSASCNFRQQVHYPAELEVGLRIVDIGTSSFTAELVIVRAGTDDVVADGRSVTVWTDYAAGKSTRMSDALKQVLNPPDYTV